MLIRRQITARFTHWRPIAGAVLMAALATVARAEPAVNAEAADVARSLGRLDQSFSYRGLRAGHGAATTQGASFGDRPDAADRAAERVDRSLPPGMQMLDVLPQEGSDPQQ